MNSIWGGVTTVFSFFTQVAETYDKLIPDELPIGWERGARWRDGTRAFRKIGHCPLALAIDFCHRHNIEIFLTYRMNDIHDGSAGEPNEFSNWKRDHPQYLLGRQEEADRYPFSRPRHFWSVLNYEQPEVHNYTSRSWRMFVSVTIWMDWSWTGYGSPPFFSPLGTSGR